jgi:hypothetical protein
MGKRRNAFIILVEKPQKKRQLRRHRRRWENMSYLTLYDEAVSNGPYEVGKLSRIVSGKVFQRSGRTLVQATIPAFASGD